MAFIMARSTMLRAWPRCWNSPIPSPALPRAPERSVAFLAVTAEESGLLGSAHYANDPAIPMNKTIGGINMDSMNVYGPTNDVIVVGYGSSGLEDVLRNKVAAQDRIVTPEKHPEHGKYYRSDHSISPRRVFPCYTPSPVPITVNWALITSRRKSRVPQKPLPRRPR